MRPARGVIERERERERETRVQKMGRVSRKSQQKGIPPILLPALYKAHIF